MALSASEKSRIHYILSSPASQLLVREAQSRNQGPCPSRSLTRAGSARQAFLPLLPSPVHPGLHERPHLREGRGPAASWRPLRGFLCLPVSVSGSNVAGKCSHPSWPCRQGPRRLEGNPAHSTAAHSTAAHPSTREPRENRAGAASVTAQAPISPLDTAIPRRPCSSLGAAEPGAAPAREGLGSARRIALWNT